MKFIPIYLLLIFFSSNAQPEIKKNKLKFSADLPPTIAPKPEIKKEEKKFTFEAPPKYTPNFPNPNSPLPRSGGGIVQNKFENPNAGILKKLNQREGDNVDGSKSDRFLGDFRNNGKLVKIVCRDYGEIDGDRVRVYNNDKIVEYDLTLLGNYQAVTINLVPGFNRIDFQALNMGTSGPNTAEFQMFDDKGVLISSNQWNLTTGVKATLIVVKE